MFSVQSISASSLIGNVKKLTLSFICILIIVILLVAGLWPFDFHPENKVGTLKNEKGMGFHGAGMVLSAAPFSLSDTVFRTGFVTIELVVRPWRESTDGSPSILTLFAVRGVDQFIVAQWNSALVLKTPLHSPGSPTKTSEVGISNVFTAGRSRLLTITSSYEGTTISLDGFFIRKFPHFSLLPEVLTGSGCLVLGNVHPGRGYWNGDVLGLAVFDRELDAREIGVRAHEWKENGMLTGGPGKSPIGLYLFQENSGPRIANSSGSLPDLVVPATFTPLTRTVLQLPWKRQWRLLPDAKDVAINILGFIPFGFFLAARIGRGGHYGRIFIRICVLGAGAVISLSIELLQAGLPMRDSSLTDVICNTIGAFIGTMVLERIERGSHTLRD